MENTRPELNERALEQYLANMTPKQLRQLLTPRPPKPHRLVLPSIDPANVTEPPQDLAAEVEAELGRLLGFYRWACRTDENVRAAFWEFDQRRAQFLPRAARLKAISEDAYARICGDFEHLLLAPYFSTKQETPADPRDQAIINRFRADRSYGRRSSAAHGEEREPNSASAPLSSLVGY